MLQGTPFTEPSEGDGKVEVTLQEAQDMVAVALEGVGAVPPLGPLEYPWLLQEKGKVRLKMTGGGDG